MPCMNPDAIEIESYHGNPGHSNCLRYDIDAQGAPLKIEQLVFGLAQPERFVRAEYFDSFQH